MVREELHLAYSSERTSLFIRLGLIFLVLFLLVCVFLVSLFVLFIFASRSRRRLDRRLLGRGLLLLGLLVGDLVVDEVVEGDDAPDEAAGVHDEHLVVGVDVHGLDEALAHQVRHQVVYI